MAELERDVKTAVILGGYVLHWGVPDERVTTRRGRERVDLYSFPASVEGILHRFATVGVSDLRRDDGRATSWEFLMILPRSLAGASRQEVTTLMFDVMAYSLRPDVRVASGTTIPETPLMPKAWKPRGLLFDEARGEPKEVGSAHVGLQHVELLWLVPIYGEEERLISREGIEAFDVLDQGSGWSLADPARPPVVRLRGEA